MDQSQREMSIRLSAGKDMGHCIAIAQNLDAGHGAGKLHRALGLRNAGPAIDNQHGEHCQRQPQRNHQQP